VKIIGIIESASLNKDNFLLSFTGHIPFSNYPIHSIFSENNKTDVQKSSAGRPACVFGLTEYYEICLLVCLTKQGHVHLLYKAGTLYLFPMRPHLVFFWTGVVGRFAVFCHSQVLYIWDLCNSYVGFVL
jgi:hypothetical protein